MNDPAPGSRLPALASHFALNHRSADAAFLALVAALLAAYLGFRVYGVVPLRYVAGAAVVVLAAGAWSCRTALASPKRLAAAAAVAAVSMGLAVVSRLVDPDASLFAIATNITAVLVGWAITAGVWVVGRPSAADPEIAAASRWSTTAGAAGLVVVAGGLATFHWLARGTHVQIVDETLYILQGELMGAARFVQSIDPALERFFALKYTTQSGGHLYTQYPPGWPALLKVFSLFGLRWWANVVLGTVGVWCTCRLGTRLYSRGIGVLAATLLATHYVFAALAASYFAHTAAMTVGVASALALAAGDDATGRGRHAFDALGGFGIACVGAIRPLTGLALGTSLLLWTIGRRTRSATRIGLMALSVGLGAVPVAGAVMFYNHETTGSAFRFGYTVTNGEHGRLGFGERGEIRYDNNGEPYAALQSYTPRKALSNTLGLVWDVVSDFPIPFLLIPLVVIGWWSGYRPRWPTVGAFLILPVIHVFYYWSSIRFYTELFPYIWLGVAGVLMQVVANHRWVGRRLVAGAVLANLLTLPVMLRVQWGPYADLRPYFDVVTDAAEERGPLLVFVEDSDDATSFFAGMYWFNAVDFFGPVIVARDLGAENQKLVDAFPNRHTVTLRWQGPGAADASLKPWEAGSP